MNSKPQKTMKSVVKSLHRKGSLTKALTKKMSTKVTLTKSSLHHTPKDIKDTLQSKKNADVSKLWDSLTPLAQNEWICYVTIVKTAKTRSEHIARLCADLRAGKRRPCCWPGCPHRRPSAQKWFK